MEIRRLLLSDLDSYFANRLRALENSPSAFMTTLAEEKVRGREHFAKTLSHNGNETAIFGAVAQGIVVGTVGIRQEDRQKSRHKGKIFGMYVDASYRGQGIGGKLIDAAIAFAKREMDVVAIYLSVESGNREARRLYESRGFVCWGTEPLAMKAGGLYFDEDHMVLKL